MPPASRFHCHPYFFTEHVRSIGPAKTAQLSAIGKELVNLLQRLAFALWDAEKGEYDREKCHSTEDKPDFAVQAYVLGEHQVWHGTVDRKAITIGQVSNWQSSSAQILIE